MKDITEIVETLCKIFDLNQSYLESLTVIFNMDGTTNIEPKFKPHPLGPSVHVDRRPSGTMRVGG